MTQQSLPPELVDIIVSYATAHRVCRPVDADSPTIPEGFDRGLLSLWFAGEPFRSCAAPRLWLELEYFGLAVEWPFQQHQRDSPGLWIDYFSQLKVNAEVRDLLLAINATVRRPHFVHNYNWTEEKGPYAQFDKVFCAVYNVSLDPAEFDANNLEFNLRRRCACRMLMHDPRLTTLARNMAYDLVRQFNQWYAFIKTTRAVEENDLDSLLEQLVLSQLPATAPRNFSSAKDALLYICPDLHWAFDNCMLYAGTGDKPMTIPLQPLEGMSTLERASRLVHLLKTVWIVNFCKRHPEQGSGRHSGDMYPSDKLVPWLFKHNSTLSPGVHVSGLVMMVAFLQVAKQVFGLDCTVAYALGWYSLTSVDDVVSTVSPSASSNSDVEPVLDRLDPRGRTKDMFLIRIVDRTTSAVHVVDWFQPFDQIRVCPEADYRDLYGHSLDRSRTCNDLAALIGTGCLNTVEMWNYPQISWWSDGYEFHFWYISLLLTQSKRTHHDLVDFADSIRLTLPFHVHSPVASFYAWQLGQFPRPIKSRAKGYTPVDVIPSVTRLPPHTEPGGWLKLLSRLY